MRGPPTGLIGFSEPLFNEACVQAQPWRRAGAKQLPFPNGLSMTTACTTDFDDWLVETFARVGSFTMLIVLVEIGETSISLLASSYLHIVGDETRWTDMVDLLSVSRAPWNGAAFFQGDRDGLIDDAIARQRLRSLTRHLETDRSILKHGEFFNAQGLRMKIEETGTN
jgi:hypothetical protein